MQHRLIDVNYEFADGVHMFTSDDRFGLGLCAVSADLATAYNEVSRQLTILLEKNHGIKTECRPLNDLDTFVSWLKNTIKSKPEHVTPISAIINMKWINDYIVNGRRSGL